MPANAHACCVVLRDRGVLIRGASGSGKSSLALELIARVAGGGGFARLVADDQLFLEVRSGRLVATRPSPIAGLVELRGFGIGEIAALPSAVVDLVATLVPSTDTERHPDERWAVIEGCRLPDLVLGERGSRAAALAIFAALRLPPFG